eukprot:m.206972 g.206972  ORF g.206972 m.206972 type:complete len:141 (+) comp39688_c0_seq1:204-626(+)
MKQNISAANACPFMKYASEHNESLLEEEFIKWLLHNVSAKNICAFIDFVTTLRDEKSDFAEKFFGKMQAIICLNAISVLASDSFANSLSRNRALAIVQCPDLQAGEINVFNAVVRWIESQGRDDDCEDLDIATTERQLNR